MKLNVFAKAVIVASLAAVGLGCGASSGNNNGLSFTLYGFFTPVSSENGGAALEGPCVQVGVPEVVSYGLQNNLEGQGIRTQRVFIKYHIANSSLNIPSTSVVMGGAILGPAGGQASSSSAGSSSSSSRPNTPGSSTPDGFNFPNQAMKDNFIIPPDISDFLVQNADRLPGLPFVMEAEAFVTGITTSGDSIDTNTLVLPMIVSASCGSTTTTTGGAASIEESSDSASSDESTSSDDSQSSEDNSL